MPQGFNISKCGSHFYNITQNVVNIRYLDNVLWSKILLEMLYTRENLPSLECLDEILREIIGI